MNIGDLGWSILRTVVPTWVGGVVGWLIEANVLDSSLEGDAESVFISLSAGVWYSAARALEPHAPSWVTTIAGLVGRSPTYDTDA